MSIIYPVFTFFILLTKLVFVNTIVSPFEDTATNNDIVYNKPHETVTNLANKYISQSTLTTFMNRIKDDFPTLVRLYTIPVVATPHSHTTVVLVSNLRDDHSVLKPSIRLTPGLDQADGEVLGREILLRLILYLLQNYRTDNQIRWLLDNTSIHILLSTDPGVYHLGKEQGDCEARQPRLIPPNKLNWRIKSDFIMSAGLQGGRLGYTIPVISHTGTFKRQGSHNTDVLEDLGESYWKNHRSSSMMNICKTPNRTFASFNSESTLNQDDDIDIIFQLSCCKYPPASNIESIWDANKSSLLSFLTDVHRGVKGTIKNQFGKPISKASMKVRGKDSVFHSTSKGEFWQILLPGVYTLEVNALGYVDQEMTFAIDGQIPTLLDVVLVSDGTLPEDMMRDQQNRRSDQLEERTPVYFPKIPRNVYDTILNGLNLLNLLTPLKMALG